MTVLPDDGFWTRTTSPDGAHVWIVEAWEARMSHWVMAGRLVRTSPETEIFGPARDWSFEDRTWTSSHVLRLVGRRYPGRLPGIVLTLDVRAMRGTVTGPNLEELQRDGNYGSVKRNEVPPVPSGDQPFDVLLHWLAMFPAE